MKMYKTMKQILVYFIVDGHNPFLYNIFRILSVFLLKFFTFVWRIHGKIYENKFELPRPKGTFLYAAASVAFKWSAAVCKRLFSRCGAENQRKDQNILCLWPAGVFSLSYGEKSCPCGKKHEGYYLKRHQSTCQ